MTLARSHTEEGRLFVSPQSLPGYVLPLGLGADLGSVRRYPVSPQCPLTPPRTKLTLIGDIPLTD